MTLSYANDIAKIDNCPLENDPRDIVLFRMIKEEQITNEDLKPKALNERGQSFKDICEGWGISTYSSISEILMNYEGMNEKLRSRFTHVASIKVTADFGIKYQSGNSKFHFTLFPIQDEKVLEKFIIAHKF